MPQKAALVSCGVDFSFMGRFQKVGVSLRLTLMIYLKNLKSLWVGLGIFLAAPGWVAAQQVAEAMPTPPMTGQIHVPLTQFVILGANGGRGAVQKNRPRGNGDGPGFSYSEAGGQIHKHDRGFSKVPFGDYTVGVFHDLNKNGELDTNFIGYPKEDMAVSNNAKGGPFGGPPWHEAKVQLNGPKLIIGELKMYPFGPDKRHDG